MINHARTLLLNISPQSYNADMLGEEYIPPFIPSPLPAYLQFAHRTLFGSNPDKVFLNFRAYELLNLIHSTELAEFIFALDPRITYSVTDNDDFFRGRVTTEVTKISGIDYAQLNLVGTAKPDNAKGRAYFEYLLRILENTETTAIAQLVPIFGGTDERVVSWRVPAPSSLQMRAARPTMAQTTANLGANLGISEPSPVPDTQLLFQLSLNQAAIDLLATEDPFPFKTESLFATRGIALETNLALKLNSTLPLNTPQLSDALAEWRLKVYAKPDSAISVCLPKLELLGEPFYLELFDVDNATEPYTTFKNIWFDHPLPAYRLGAFVLAMIYRMNSARVGNG